ncbi:MAG: hypothetical protein E7463_08110 [Ruminococcaceae bacterium]|nr:hypothetical protein [Oscillospiraceae bacterium]
METHTKRNSIRALHSAAVGMMALLMLVLMVLPVSTAKAADETSFSVAALPHVAMGAAIRLDGKTIGICDSIEIAQKAIDLSLSYLGVTGGETSVVGNLEIVAAVHAKSECADLATLFRKFTQEEPLPVMSVVTREYTETVPCETITVNDPKTYECQIEVLQQGVNGEYAYTVEDIYVNGELTKTVVVNVDIVTKPVTHIEQVGTQPKPEWWPTGTFIQPAQGKISSEFGKRRYEHHTGIDIANKSGSPVVAADGGTVLFAGWLGNYGRYVVIDHNGIYTCYAHNSKLLVSEGDHVVQGQQIARMGSTGRSTGPHCHFEIHDGNAFLQPRDFIDFVETERSK